MVQGWSLLGTTSSNKLTLRKMKAASNDGTYSVKVTNGGGTITSELPSHRDHSSQDRGQSRGCLIVAGVQAASQLTHLAEAT